MKSTTGTVNITERLRQQQVAITMIRDIAASGLIEKSALRAALQAALRELGAKRIEKEVETDRINAQEAR